MRRPVLASLITLVAVLALVSAPLAAQTKAAAKPAAKTSAIPRTPDGHPDFQGVYSNATNVPVARPANLGAKEFYTDEADRTASRQAPAAGRGGAAPAGGGRAGRGGGAAAAADPEGNGLAVHYSTEQFGLSGPSVVRAPSLRTSIISGPEGRVPALTPEAQKRAQDKQAYNRDHQWDGPESRPLAERCITWGHVGPPMMPVGYNSELQIVQGPGYVSVVQEMIHDFRVIPTDNKPHLPSAIGQWMGDARGHWEGDTLVVETTNFSGRTQVQGAWITDKLKVTEKFSMIDAETVLYQFTVDDPGTWVKPWSGELTMTKIDAPLFEYACNEGNYGMANNLSGARATEKK